LKIDFETLSAELVRSIRGRRSCADVSRRAGYRSNVVHRWERQQAWPSASDFLRYCQSQRIDTARVFTEFFGQRPPWLGALAPVSAQAVASFLSQMRSTMAITSMARDTNINRYTLARWLKGSAEPRLPDFLRMIEVLSRRVLDFVAALVDPDGLPSIKRRWARVLAARAIAYEHPRSHAVLRALELDEYRHGGFRSDGWLEQRLGMSSEEVETCLTALKRAGQIRLARGKWQPVDVLRVDTRADPERARITKLAWLNVAAERLRSNAPGNFGFSLFAISRQDLRRLRELHLEYVRAMQALIAASKNNECVGLYCAQLLDLDSSEENALL
jgi:transcriptional regulator with XRE-family HTH domain